MPSISKIRFTNVIYEGGNKRYNDETFLFEGHNGAILLENGGGKTVFIQTVLQAVLPHVDLADRKIKETLKLEEAPAHIGVEWILNEQPRRYALTCVSLFLTKNGLDSFRYAYDYGENDRHSIENIPFVKPFAGKTRAADRGEIQEYYSHMEHHNMNAHTFSTIKDYKSYLEENFHIIPKEWESIVKINSAEGGVENFFDECKTTGQLFDRLLIPTVEDSLTGFQKDEFAETFEKHRDGFKEYKQLKEKIAENERIKLNVERYVDVFSSLHEKQQDYQKMKEEAKAYTLLAKEKQDLISKENQDLLLTIEVLKDRQIMLQQKEASYEIAVEKEKLAYVLKDLHYESEKQSDFSEKLAGTDSNYYSLKLAEYKKNLKIEEQKKQYNEEKLEELDQEFDTEEIRDQLEQNAREIKGYFVNQEEKFLQERKNVEFEKNAVKNRLDGTQKALKELQKEQRNNLNLETEKYAFIKSHSKEMEKIQLSIFSDPKQEKVEEQLPQWIKKVNELDFENTELMGRNKEIKSENKRLALQVDRIVDSLQEMHKQKSSVTTRKKAFDTEHQKLKLKLSEKKVSWSRYDSLYLKRESIEKQIIEEIHKLTNDWDKLLEKERMAFRFVDDYGNQDVFYSDSYLSQQLLKWQQQFSYLESGVAYIQSLPAQSDYRDSYPLWPVTLVTTAKEKEKVQDKIKSVIDSLQFPVNILSLDEATHIVQQGTDVYQEWVAPKHWVTNMDEDSFRFWKENMMQKAHDVKSSRLDKETERQTWLQLQNDLSSFFYQYPYADYLEILDELVKMKEEIFRLSAKKENLQRKNQDLEQEYEINQKKQAENKDVMNGFHSKIEQGERYLKLDKECDRLTNELRYVKDKLREIEGKLQKLEREIEDDQLVVSELEQALNSNKVQVNMMHQDRLYQKVKNAQPAFTSNTIEILEERRNHLQFELKKLSRGRGELVAAIGHATETIERIHYEMKQLRKEHHGLHEDLEFPVDGLEKMNELWAKREEYQHLLNSANQKVIQLTSKRDQLEGGINLMTSKVETVIEFDRHLDEVRLELDNERMSIQSETESLNQSLERIEKQFKAIQSIVIAFEKYDVKHRFLKASIPEKVLSNEEITEFTYRGKKKTAEITSGLEEKNKDLENEATKVNKAKVHFISFCRQDIKDIRMREMAIQGIENKVSYEEVLTYRDLLEGRIHTANKYAEQNMITHDQELEQFIIHIHTHLKKITDELKLIPLKTKIKVEEDWKQIFLFNIPDWDVQEGKSLIRDHIDWILNQLEKETYKDENGHDDIGKIKKDLEKWLQSKQLLQVVMKNQAMKVTCRKVTNDNKVTKGSYSWEQSNVWSGGEKWSKNMTLFLGLLNYIAEKRQHIPRGLKRHRTVIVDNPFGKASSDHVLNPVFFIAEQLGFQILALTAHAEGKFLRDYFPVIYSCRLRQAAGNEKQIMTKEKNIQHAYFIDHDPKALEKLGEVEQMELF
ncbi:hypothetical protein [Niallia sp. Krafla_26]|uniref:hypothetical protein n=1 Tax=Niallia sp. Krafla_26 TaxID=3064703 RepID=UPI003D17381C